MGSRTHRRSTTSILTVALATALTATACSDDGGEAQPLGSSSTIGTVTDPTSSTRIDSVTTRSGPVPNGPGRSRALFDRFDSCDAFLSAVKAKALEQVTPWGLNNPYGYGYPMPLATNEGMATATTAAAAVDQRSSGVAVGDAASSNAPGQVSQTNTQEAGIDEGDLVDTDGRSIYTVTDGMTLRVIDITAGKVTDTVTMPDGSGGHQLMLDGDRLVVVSQVWTTMSIQNVATDRAVLGPWNQGVNQTRIAIYDVSDPSNVKLLEEERVDGGAVAVRNVDHHPRVVMRSSFGAGLAFLQPATESAAQAALDHNRKIIENSTAADWLPKRYDSANDAGQQAIDCSNVGMPTTFAGMGLVWVASVDLDGDGSVRGAGGVIATGETVYASPTSLYVASNQWINPIDLERQGSAAAPTQHTDIHQFDLTDVSGARWVASGSVDGSLLNSYSMSEYDGRLRVATTTQPTGPIMIDESVANTTVMIPPQVAESSSSVTVLNRSGEDLAMESSITGLGKGQQIYAVRFIGPMGYVVTFRRTDPLYVIDLHDPKQPEVSGELHIPGYSAYLLPVGDGKLIGIGQDASENSGRTTGAKVSLFDVTDPANPRESDHLAVGGESMAEYDPHAITWLDPSLLFGVIDYNTGRNELLVIDVTGDSLTDQGRLEMPDYQQAQRSVIVGDRIVAIGYDRVIVFDRQSLQEVDTIAF
ncbi:MAG: beta-propeller domain-containing protein [Acidimicrobiia bacterium]